MIEPGLNPSRKSVADYPNGGRVVGAAFAFDSNFDLCHVSCCYYCDDDGSDDANSNYCFYRYCC